MRSKRFEALAKRPVNQDGFVKEWIEEGFIAMESPNDPKPSIKIVNGAVTELDGKPVSDFDLIDHFIARYGINPVSYTHLDVYKRQVDHPLDNRLVQRAGETVVRSRFGDDLADDVEAFRLDRLRLLDVLHQVLLRPRRPASSARR